MQNNRIDISELARKALDFETAFVGKSLKDVASEAILRGVSEKSLELANSVLGGADTSSGSTAGIKEEPITYEGPIKHDIEVQKEPTYKSPFDSATEELIRHGVEEGMTGAAIARKIGKPKSTVNKWIAAQKEMGKL